MKKLTALILITALLFSIFTAVPVSAQDSDVPPESAAEEIDGQGNNKDPGDDAETDSDDLKEKIKTLYAGSAEHEPDEEGGETEEPSDEPEEQQYYYITQEEFEKYRDDYFKDLTTENLFLAIGAQGLESLQMMLAPLLVPFVMFLPFAGGILTGVMLMMPFQGIISFAEVFTGAFYIMFHRDEMYNDFSADCLYAMAEYDYNEETEGSELTGYTIYYKEAESDATLWADCLPVAIKNN